MEQKFSVEADPARDLVRIKMSGFLTSEDIKAFLDARQFAHQKLACAPNQHLTLTDLSEIKIQSQDTVQAFQQVLSAPEYRSRRLAFVVSPSLARSQLTRALANRDARIFEDVASAEHYLLS